MTRLCGCCEKRPRPVTGRSRWCALCRRRLWEYRRYGLTVEQAIQLWRLKHAEEA